MKAIWKNTLIAQSENTLVFEGDIYFPASSLKKEFFRESPDRTFSATKGDLKNFDLIVEGEMLANAASCIVSPNKPAAICLKGLFNFTKDVQIISN